MIREREEMQCENSHQTVLLIGLKIKFLCFFSLESEGALLQRAQELPLRAEMCSLCYVLRVPSMV